MSAPIECNRAKLASYQGVHRLRNAQSKRMGVGKLNILAACQFETQISAVRVAIERQFCGTIARRQTPKTPATVTGGNEVPLDPWGHPFQYRIPSQRPQHEFDLFSLGPTGQPGGSGENAEIYNK
jgi:hypothetical protein